MATLLYLHGFLSSPGSSKAVQMRDWLAVHRPEIQYQCPFLTPYFGETRKRLEGLVTELLPEPVYLMGSSLGGFLATWLAEKYDLRAVLINPAVQPSVLDHGYTGVELKNFHTGDTYVLNGSHVSELHAADTPVIRRHDNYWLLVQTGDETLDYRLAVKKYNGCRQLIEQGGDHGFHDFARHIPEAVRFLAEASS
ncbi:MAG: esterase YqiA [Gammaproteobacteria bacterium RIFCSPLOWO2_02_FULL_56_15]|nr:MAG: esterase YqiA [Gammaproteobacteria bacterium RIFCSPLOWO2_02_FULL_56_15]